MGRRLEPKDENDLILDDKLKMARTIIRGEHDQQMRRELNDLEAAIKQEHMREVNSGSVTRPLWSSATELRKALAAGSEPAQIASGAAAG